MKRVFDITTEDVFKSSFSTKDLDITEYENDLTITTLTLFDINNVSVLFQVSIFNALTSLKAKVTVNVITGNKIINDYEDETFFTSAFSTLFPYNVEKHIDFRRDVQLSLAQ